MNQQELQLNIHLTLSDYLRANYWLLFKKLKTLFFFILIAVVGYPLFVFIGVIPKNPDDSYWGMLIPLGVLLLILVGTYFGAKHQMSSHKALNEMQKYSFTDDGIHNESSSTSGFQKWENIIEGHETSSHFLLFYSLNQLYIIPKKCFEKDYHIAEFKELLNQQLGTKFKGK